MCNFCHIQGNNRNSIQHFDIDCFDKRNPNSRNFDPTTLSFQEQLQLATTNSIQLEEERQRQLEEQRQRQLEEQRQRQNQTLVHVVHPHPYLGVGQPVAIVNMGNGQGMVIPIGRFGIMNPRFRRF